MKKVGLEEIAKQLGVSKTTVSLVLNNKAKENRISDEIMKKVKKLAEELNYTPNHFARGLRKGTTNTVGLIIGDISNPFFSRIARYIEDEAAKEDYHVIVASSDEKKEKTEQLIHILLDKKVDGLIITPNYQNSEIVLWLKKQEVPFVLVDRYFPKIKTNYVGVDNGAGISSAITHLYEQGYEKIALITYHPLMSNIKERINGFREALKKNNLRLHNQYIQEVSYTSTEDDVKLAIDQLLALTNPPRAILFATNKIGLYGMEHLNARNVRIPQDISVISFDDDPAFRLSYPPVTVIEQPLKEIATDAARLLLEQMKTKKIKYEEIVKPVNLIIRKS
ncbi:MAG: hypothetical protein A2W90_09170 [Bacteroidetes bacterium GWF2_42_66]|nr:MAG: hypothetical protein A2W92_12145 [Bacteroidetes bacterium GWA2_42_15]OFY00578.1 MAG: hypothetical protein A2W89_20485 [Bacteroidetes bacterium GWE2_42_39]OFY42312.1 MAG: hypothetical protein A2W90_09170 [Bacteroidetes bacterium GWF2_42_66]HAZ02065.1 LacI family transcriptional regulator [Marinilabiliales bacterium]HBL76465.1 LacI family transcriptional regulator [Prolixibacteraceae bacterium]